MTVYDDTHTYTLTKTLCLYAENIHDVFSQLQTGERKSNYTL